MVTCLENMVPLVRCVGLPGRNWFTLLFSALLHDRAKWCFRRVSNEIHQSGSRAWDFTAPIKTAEAAESRLHELEEDLRVTFQAFPWQLGAPQATSRVALLGLMTIKIHAAH